MKLRIRGNSIRLRLTQPEVAQLQERGVVVERIRFGPGDDQSLEYALELSRGDGIAASLSGHCITVQVPRDMALQWASDEAQVGMNGEMPVAGGETLRLLIEKDFACLTRGADGARADGEDDSDAYPNPNAALGAC